LNFDVGINEFLLDFLELVSRFFRFFLGALMHAANKAAYNRAIPRSGVPWIFILVTQLLKVHFWLKTSCTERSRIVRQLRLRFFEILPDFGLSQVFTI
jgi:hypothetical protein